MLFLGSFLTQKMTKQQTLIGDAQMVKLVLIGEFYFLLKIKGQTII